MFGHASPRRPADDLGSRVRTCRNPGRLKQPRHGFGVRSEEFVGWPGATAKSGNAQVGEQFLVTTG